MTSETGKSLSRRGRAVNSIAKLQTFIRKNKFDPLLIKQIDWWLLLLVIGICIFGVVCIFAATGVTSDESANSLLDLLSIQPVTYARLQLMWLGVGLIAIAATLYFSYSFLSDFSNLIYWLNIGLLLMVLLFSEQGRGGMNGWFRWGSGRTFQPSEIAKLAIIISLAKWFSNRKKPIETFGDLFPVLMYVGVPLVLICAQPDFGTALVYVAIFGVMLFTSGTNYKLLIAIVVIAVLCLIPIWYYLVNAEEVSFRLKRILVFLDPESDPDTARQITNAKIAIGSAGLWGKGLFREGSFALLNYIPDDYTDFIFAIVAETFGFVGAGGLALAYFLLLLRLTALSSQAGDAFGSYLTIGVMAMLLFHIFENVCMVIGLMPVTGIPLPFVSYGGSNMLANMVGIGIVLNVHMRRKEVRLTSNATKPSIQI